MSAARADVDAVVIGAGHNGLVAAAMLADAGWDVLVVEADTTPGGAVRSDREVHPDFVTDRFSAFYPFGYASPVLQELDLGRHGLRWEHAPAVLTHVLPDGRAVTLGRDVDATAASVDTFAPGDGDAWRALTRQFDEIRDQVLRALFRPFPPVRHAAGLARTLGTAELLRLIRFALQPVRRAGDELFDGEGAKLLLAGNALHTDLGPESAGGAVFGWLLAMVGQTLGFPVPRGGAGALVDALVRRTGPRVELRYGVAVESVDVVGGRAVGVRLADGTRVSTSTVVAEVSAPALYRSLLPAGALPPRLLDDLERFQWDNPTVKVDWALSAPIPWAVPGAGESGTVHLGADLDGLTRYSASLAMGRTPRTPFVLLGQMTTADPRRSPVGTESAWGYTHLASGTRITRAVADRQADRVEEVVERHAPGFRDLVLGRRVQSPADLEATDANLHGGAVNGGTASIHQQLVFRPVPGLGRSETVVDGVYLASAAVHPGGGVHGAPGANAALAALARRGVRGRARRAVIDLAHRRIYR